MSAFDIWMPPIFLSGVGLWIFLFVSSYRRTTRNLQGLATRLGLEFVPARNWFKQSRIVGTRRARAVQIFTYLDTSSDGAYAAVTAQTVMVGPLRFVLKKQGFSTMLTELFGMPKIFTGDEEFDAAWFVQTNQPEFMRALLLPELRAKLMTVRQAGAKGKFELRGGEIKYTEAGLFADTKLSERFAALADIICDLADAVEVAAKGQGKA
jgi:hypothetical protein